MWKICQYKFLMPHSWQHSISLLSSFFLFFLLRFCSSLMVPAFVSHYLSLQTLKQQNPLCLHPQSSQGASRIWKEMVGKTAATTTAVYPSVCLSVLRGSLWETFNLPYTWGMHCIEMRCHILCSLNMWHTNLERQSQQCRVWFNSFWAMAIIEPEKGNLSWHAQKGESKNRAYNRQHSALLN